LLRVGRYILAFTFTLALALALALAFCRSSLPLRSSVSANSYPSFLSSTLSHTSPYAWDIRASAVRCIFSASAGELRSARRGEERTSMEVRKVEKVVRAKVSGLGDVAGRRDNGVYIASRSQPFTLS
jgi:hypothetical protein